MVEEVHCLLSMDEVHCPNINKAEVSARDVGLAVQEKSVMNRVKPQGNRMSSWVARINFPMHGLAG